MVCSDGISIHAPPRGATCAAARFRRSGKFQFTPLREGRRLDGIERALSDKFQFTPLREGRPCRARISPCSKFAFQFTPLREGRRRAAADALAADLFQFTPLREGRREGRREMPLIVYFNSRPSARGDDQLVGNLTDSVIFQFTPLREGRLRNRAGLQFAPYFNSRPSARGDKALFASAFSVQTFQFTPLREGRRCLTLSIAPALAFQFTPLREGRPDETTSCPTSRQHFNSRPSARGDPSRPASFSPCIISIHAPPRGATVSRSRLEYSTTGFQFTPLREGRRCRDDGRSIHILFQFTPLREGRPVHAGASLSPANFNSRPSARGDQQVTFAIFFHLISIHAPPRGATFRRLARPPPPLEFQFTPLREGRRVAKCEPRGLAISIHAPPRGATSALQRSPSGQLFQFTPLREGRRRPHPRREKGSYFNSRPSARGDRYRAS